MKILIVEDDAGIGRFITNGLHIEGHDVDWLREGGEAIPYLQTGTYDAMILDLMLPDIDGYDICKKAKAMRIKTPICMLTARDELEDKLEGFRSGADDYLTKPFAFKELLARLKVITSRSNNESSQDRIEIGNLQIDLSGRTIKMAGQSVTLTRREFDILLFLARNVGHAMTREQILQGAWDLTADVTLNNVDVYIGYLRRKLATAGRNPSIQTVYGVGFRLD